MKLKLWLVLFTFMLALLTTFVIHYYSFLFSLHIKGEVIGIDRVTQPTSIIGSSQIPDSQLFSFAVAIKVPSGEIFTASSEDRQWAVVEKGQCAEVKFFPYPPWQLDKSGTYFGARLLKLFACPKN